MRPSFAAVNTPAFSNRLRCRETTEKSTEQHSATSVTEHGRPHFVRQASSLMRVGSHSALNSSGSSSSSTGPQHFAACLGVISVNCIVASICKYSLWVGVAQGQGPNRPSVEDCDQSTILYLKRTTNCKLARIGRNATKGVKVLKDHEQRRPHHPGIDAQR